MSPYIRERLAARRTWKTSVKNFVCDSASTVGITLAIVAAVVLGVIFGGFVLAMIFSFIALLAVAWVCGVPFTLTFTRPGGPDEVYKLRWFTLTRV